MATQKEILEKLDYTHSAISELGQILSEESNFIKISKSVLHHIMGTILISRGAIFTYDAKKRILKLAAQRGLNEKYDEKYILTKEDTNNAKKFPNIVNPIETFENGTYSFTESLLKRFYPLNPIFWIPSTSILKR